MSEADEVLSNCARRRVIVMKPMLAARADRIGDAQTYPSKPIRLIVPYAPGGGTDAIVRPIAQSLTQSLGPSSSSIIEECREGALS